MEINNYNINIFLQLINNYLKLYFLYSFSFVAPCLLQNGTDVKKKFETPSKSVRTTERNFFDDYTLMDVLGCGSYSICKLARHNATNQQYAVKVRYLDCNGKG